MSTVVYQSLQSRLETQLMEAKSFKLKLSSPKLVFSQSLEMALQSHLVVPVENDSKKVENACSPPNLGGWNFLQTLPATITSQTPSEKQSSYVDPYAKRSSTWLSDKSLKLCTENLGNEAGTDFLENSIFTPAATCSKTETKVVQIMKRERQKPKCRQTSEPRRPLPPPLTTLQGPESLQVRPHREDGRLILKARKPPVKTCCLQADRSNGRLRLSLIDTTATNTSDDSSHSQSHQDGKEAEHSSNMQIMPTKITTAPETTDCSISDEEISGGAGNNNNTDMNGEDSRRRQKNMMIRENQNQRRTASSSNSCSSSWCRYYDEGHNSIKNTTNKKEAGIMNMVTSMVKLETHFWVSSSSS